MIDYVWLVLVFPLVGFACCGLLGKRLPDRVVGGIGCGALLLSFLVSLLAWAELLGRSGHDRVVEVFLFNWIQAGRFQADFQLLFDPLSAVMILIVTGVGFLIHVYSVGYMAGESGYYRYFSYLNLFVLMMSILVLAGNYLLLFVGWEGVGLCSYLLIGYSFSRKAAGDAAKKAFIVNRIGDVGFVLGIFLLFRIFRSVDFLDIFPQAATASASLLTAATLLLLVGALGKSAQIPLYVWLPDAMEGPTPVSALIHAATMVTAGVYMIARSASLFALAPTTLSVVAVIGLATALVAGCIALTQRDIKKVLAYSTVSQLGYMFLALGVGAWGAAVFHLYTHAFFKALLFLGAGSVIHAMHHEQDMLKMGGLRSRLKITYWTMLMGALAISGVPAFSGFFSKDEILWSSFVGGNWIFWLVGVFVAGLTSFYMFRLIFLTFHGAERWRDDQGEVPAHVPHESPPVMTLPLLVLALFSVVAGWVGLPGWIPLPNVWDEFLEPSLGSHEAASPSAHLHSLEIVLTCVTTIVALAAIGLAFRVYVRKPETARRISGNWPGLHTLLNKGFFVDEVYDALIVRPIRRVSTAVLWRWCDLKVVDGAVNGLAQLMSAWSGWVRLWQSGLVRLYAAWILAGVSIAILYVYLEGNGLW